jgi:two-component system, sensor histidine kinase RegB
MWLTRNDDQEPVAVLRLLLRLRLVAIVAQLAVISYVHFVMQMQLPLLPLALTIGALGAWNIAAGYRIRTGKRVQHGEVALHLTVDIIAFTSVIFLTGGSANPFVSLYLVPVALAATSLPARLAWALGALCALAYTTLLYVHIPLPPMHGGHGEHGEYVGDFDLHLAGMWVNFLIAATLIVYFVGRMSALVRKRDRELTAMREAALRERQIVEFGTFAAGAAHEINTPLSTLALLVEELSESGDKDSRLQAKTEVMKEQIDTISAKLSAIAAGAGVARSAGARAEPLSGFVTRLLDSFREAHPDVNLSVVHESALPETRIVAEDTLEQAICNVLENAAQAATESECPAVIVRIGCRDDRIELTVIDNGGGLAPDVRDAVGERIVTTKVDGLGVGVLLSRVALQRFGGELELAGNDGEGVVARITLPLQELRIDER